jgi:hypothetical protein
MTPRCDAPLLDDDLLEYWIGDSGGQEDARIEEHLFSCTECSARLEALAAMSGGLASLVRRGRVAGVISRSLLNRMQREGLHVRLFTLAPGDRVPCAAFPDDDLLVVSLRANFAGSESVTLSVWGPGDPPEGQTIDVPVGAGDVEILWASTGDHVRSLPSAHIRLTLRAHTPAAIVLGEYELDHTAV